MNASDIHTSAELCESKAGSAHPPAAMISNSLRFGRARQHDSVFLSPGYYLIRLRRYHAQESRAGRAKPFVTES